MLMTGILSSTFFRGRSIATAFFTTKAHRCCKNYNKMNKKIEQGTNSGNVVKITSIKLNKSIDFFAKLCYDKDSRDD